MQNSNYKYYNSNIEDEDYNNFNNNSNDDTNNNLQQQQQSNTRNMDCIDWFLPLFFVCLILLLFPLSLCYFFM